MHCGPGQGCAVFEKVRVRTLEFETAGSHRSGPAAPNGLPRSSARLEHLVQMSSYSIEFAGDHAPAEACWR